MPWCMAHTPWHAYSYTMMSFWRIRRNERAIASACVLGNVSVAISVTELRCSGSGTWENSLHIPPEDYYPDRIEKRLSKQVKRNVASSSIADVFLHTTALHVYALNLHAPAKKQALKTSFTRAFSETGYTTPTRDTPLVATPLVV